MITSKDVAKKVGVSVSTVSRVFSNSPKISDEVKAKVKKAAEELHYIPNGNARNLKLNKSNTYGFVITNSGNPFYIKVVTQFSNEIASDKSQIFMTFSDEDSEKELSNVKSLLSSKIRALLFTPTSDSSSEIGEMVLSNNIPTLQLFRHKFDNLDSLLIDDCHGTYLAVKELIKNGHRKIALLDTNVKITTHRAEGYKQAFEEAGLEFDPKYIALVPFGSSQAYEIISQKMEELKPTAVISVAAQKTHLVFRYLSEHDLKIKDDVSLIAYDDIEMAEHLNVTVVSHPFEEIAKSIHELIVRREKNPSAKPETKVLQPFLTIRDSIKDIN